MLSLVRHREGDSGCTPPVGVLSPPALLMDVVGLGGFPPLLEAAHALVVAHNANSGYVHTTFLALHWSFRWELPQLPQLLTMLSDWWEASWAGA